MKSENWEKRARNASPVSVNDMPNSRFDTDASKSCDVYSLPRPVNAAVAAVCVSSSKTRFFVSDAI